MLRPTHVGVAVFLAAAVWSGPSSAGIVISPVQECDRLASSAWDTQAVAPAVIKSDPQKAITTCPAALREFPSVPQFQAQLRRVYQDQSQQRIQQLEQFAQEHSGVYDQDIWNVHNTLRHLYSTMNSPDLDKAMEHSDFILQHWPMDDYILHILSEWLMDKNIPTARANLLRNVQAFPDLRFLAAASFLKIGDLYFTEGDLTRARSFFLTVAEDKTHAMAQYRTLAEERLGKIEAQIGQGGLSGFVCLGDRQGGQCNQPPKSARQPTDETQLKGQEEQIKVFKDLTACVGDFSGVSSDYAEYIPVFFDIIEGKWYAVVPKTSCIELGGEPWALHGLTSVELQHIKNIVVEKYQISLEVVCDSQNLFAPGDLANYLCKDPYSSNLVVLVHGCCTNHADLSWWNILAREMSAKIKEGQSHDIWEIVMWDWTQFTPKDSPPQDVLKPFREAYQNALNQGIVLANAIENAKNSYKYVHLIGHSAGAKLIDVAAKDLIVSKKIRQEKSFIQLTFLDAFVPPWRFDEDKTTYGYLGEYEQYYSEHYVDLSVTSTDPLDASCNVVSPYTNTILPHAFNFDITNWNAVTWNEKEYCGHWWPPYWYEKSVKSSNFRYGYPLSREGGKYPQELSKGYPPGEQCSITSEGDQCAPMLK